LFDDEQVVEHEHDVALEVGEVVEQEALRVLNFRVGGFQQCGGFATRLRSGSLQGREDVSPESRGIVVTRIRGQPRG
jgi:hypothetical protein